MKYEIKKYNKTAVIYDEHKVATARIPLIQEIRPARKLIEQANNCDMLLNSMSNLLLEIDHNGILEVCAELSPTFRLNYQRAKNDLDYVSRCMV